MTARALPDGIYRSDGAYWMVRHWWDDVPAGWNRRSDADPSHEIFAVEQAPASTPSSGERDESTRLARDVGGRIRDARNRAGLTQAQVAERLGCTPTAVSYWESGARHLPPAQVSRMAAVLGVTAPDLLPPAWFTSPAPSSPVAESGRPDEPGAETFRRQMEQVAEVERRTARFLDQTILHDPTQPDVMGNCWQTCIASLLNLPLAEVPHFVQENESMWEVEQATRSWALDHGYDMIEVGTAWLEHSDALVMLHGRSPRGVNHVVVGQGVETLHDPHPSRAGLSTIGGAFVFVPLDPARPPAPSSPVAESERPDTGWRADEHGETLMHEPSGVALDWMGVGSVPAFNDLVALVNRSTPPPTPPGEQGTCNVSAANRKRGQRAEVAVVNYLRTQGWPDARRYLSGDGRQPGDIDWHPLICLEVKDVASSAWPTWCRQAAAEAPAGTVPVVVRRTRGVTDVGAWECRVDWEAFYDVVLDRERGPFITLDPNREFATLDATWVRCRMSALVAAVRAMDAPVLSGEGT